MHRHIAVVLFLAFAFQQTCGTNVAIKDKAGKLCLNADLMVNFSVSYEKKDNQTTTVAFVLPDNVSTNQSSCGNISSLLMIDFGDGHSWSMNFLRKDMMYQADSIVFVYNLKDGKVFPDSKSADKMNVTVHPPIKDVGIDTSYTCRSEEAFTTLSVNQTLWNVHLQAFVTNGSLSENVTVCAGDQTTTTITPTTHSTTTVVPTTTTPPTTTPSPTLPVPTTGNYSISNDKNSTACLLATFGLRIGIKEGDKYEEMNLEPNVTSATGSCRDNSSVLVLKSDTWNLNFTFINDTKKFRLHVFNAAGKTRSGMSFDAGNDSLSLWEASLSNSYMCNKEQNFSISSALTLFTFDLHVQPFGVSKGLFSTAHECALDDISILIPVIVGCVLAGLIVIVVVAYLIGRRKTHAGYQTL